MTGLRLARGFSLPLEVAGEAIAILAKRGAGKTNTARVLVEELAAAKVQVVVLDPVGAWWGLRAGADGKRAGGLEIPVLGGAHGDVPLQGAAGALLADVVVDAGQSLVLDLSDFSKTEQRRFVAEFAERLYQRKARNASLLHVVLEEADEFAPQRVNAGDARMVGAIEQLVRRGRGRGLGLTMITQRSASLNKSILTQADVLIALRTTGPQDRKAIETWIEKQDVDDIDVVATLPSLQTGEAWIWNPERDLLQRVQIRLARTFDSSSTPKAGQRRTDPTLAAIDLAKLGAEIEATAERAKEQNPAELRKKIRALEARALDAEQTLANVYALEQEKLQEEAREPEVVEVPVLNGNLDRLVAAVDALRELAPQLVTAGEAIAAGATEISTAIATVKEETWKTSSSSSSSASPAARTAAPPVPPTAATTRTTSSTTPSKTTASAGRATTSPTGSGSPPDGAAPEQRILDALAWYEALGIRSPSKIAVGFLSGYRVDKKLGGNYGRALGRLREDGLIEYPGAGAVQLTDAGRAVARDPGIDHTNEAFRQAIYARLEPAEIRILENLIAVYPNAINKVDLGQMSGYRVDSKLGGNYGRALGKLRMFGLIDYPRNERGTAAALPILFPEDAGA